ncbi:MAG: ECF transporter S component [Thermaerobacter sp.]|nr:ECF transporter S component [Bacillota bacterium]REJ33861.1 MAG: ECF transporter S component [Bacillota bacterium]
MESRRVSLRQLAWMGVMTALAASLMYLEIPLPFLPPFLKYDLGDFPALVVGFALGPIPGLAVEAGKEVLFALLRGGTPVGLAANLLAGGTWVLTAAAIYWRRRTRRGAVASLVLAGLAVTTVMAVANRFVFLPLWGIPPEAAGPMIWSAIIPFNLFKVTATGAVTFVLYKRVRVVFLERWGVLAEPAASDGGTPGRRRA